MEINEKLQKASNEILKQGFEIKNHKASISKKWYYYK